MREAGLEKILVDRVKRAGGLCIKLPAAHTRGLPDRLVLLPDTVVFVELKVDKGVLSLHQKHYLRILSEMGFRCEVIYGRMELVKFLEGLDV